jgi:hypothetical protein
MGNAGLVITFVSMFALLGIVGTLVLVYAAHCFCVVVQDTAAGLDEVVWPNDPVAEWMGRAALLGWQMLVWLAPVGMVLRGTKPAFVMEEPWLVVLLFGVVLWLLFPIGVLSGLSSGSRWAFFRPKLLAGMARILPTTLGFYLLTALVLTSGLAPWYFALTGSGLLVLVAGLVGAAAVLIYARLLGRLAWRLNHLKKYRPPRFRPPTLEKQTSRPRVIVEDPWGPPPESKPKRKKKKRREQTEFAPSEDVYGLATEPEPAPPPTSELPLDGYKLADPAPSAPPAAPDLGPELPSPTELEMRLAERTPQAKPPAHPLFSGVWTFPWYETTLKAWIWLGLGGIAVGGIFKLMPRLPG